MLVALLALVDNPIAWALFALLWLAIAAFVMIFVVGRALEPKPVDELNWIDADVANDLGRENPVVGIPVDYALAKAFSGAINFSGDSADLRKPDVDDAATIAEAFAKPLSAEEVENALIDIAAETFVALCEEAEKARAADNA